MELFLAAHKIQGSSMLIGDLISGGDTVNDPRGLLGFPSLSTPPKLGVAYERLQITASGQKP
jgi:hypothetical protein